MESVYHPSVLVEVIGQDQGNDPISESAMTINGSFFHSIPCKTGYLKKNLFSSKGKNTIGREIRSPMQPRFSLSMMKGQHLVMTKALQQSLKILQMNVLDLREEILEEIEQNPVLEWKYTSPRSTSLSCEIPAQDSLISSLHAQAREAFSSQEELDIAKTVFANLDAKGFLALPPFLLAQSLSVSLEAVLRVLRTIQTFEPRGIAAQNLQECLLIQLREKRKENTFAYLVVKDHFEDFLQGRFGLLQKTYGMSKEVLQREVVNEIKTLSLQPICSSEPTFLPTPDLSLKQEEEKWIVEIEEKFLPSFRIKEEWRSLPLSKEETQVMQRFTSQGRWLMRSICRRRKILLQIGLYIVKRQRGFLEGKSPLAPLSVKEIASDLSLNESTVARACSEKYLLTPLGIKPLGFFLARALGKTHSNKGAMEVIRELLRKEDRNRPYSDREISNYLKENGIPCARRTVAKYRRKLKLSAAKQRIDHDFP